MAERRGSQVPPGTVSRQLTLVALTLAGLIAQRLPLPWSLAGLVFFIPAAVLGIRLFRSLLKARIGGLTMFGVGLTLAIIVMGLAGSAVTVAFYPAARDFQQCRERAITAQAVQECQDELTRTTQTFFGITPASR